MRQSLFYTLLLCCWTAVTLVESAKTTSGNSGGGFVFEQGAALGTVDTTSLEQPSQPGLLPDTSEAAFSLAGILKKRKGATGREKFKPTRNKNRLVKDKKGNKHVRFEQTYDGIEVVDAAMVMHIDKSGQVYAVNGEYVKEGTVEMKEQVTCEQAFNDTLLSSFGSDGVYLTDCATKIVLDMSGTAYKAWQRMVGYTTADGMLFQKTNVYISVVSGQIVAERPTIPTALSLRTEDCRNQNSTSNCQVVSTSSRDIVTSDQAVAAAHINTRATYDYYKTTFNRDSVDDNGMTLVSRVHYSVNYNNAFWNGNSMTYGDGDGVTFTYFSLAPDVVGHELTHGVTQYTSKLVYQDEPGAINEAMSDIFGAAVDRSLGASIENTWLIGEKIFTPNKPGDGLRFMASPPRWDWYPTRYAEGIYDQGGVHLNSQIISLLFVMMTMGSGHPKGLSSVVVPALETDFDASLLAASRIFYQANTACLTPMSGFYELRQCTLMYAGKYKASVEAAWEAVGFTRLNTLAPISGIKGTTGTKQLFGVMGVPPGTTVKCKTTGSNGDADLYLSMQGSRYNTTVTCASEGSNSTEGCTVGPLNGEASKVWVTINAFSAFTDLTLTCTRASTWGPIQPDTPVTGLSASQGYANLFILSDIPPLSSVSCVVGANSVGTPVLYGSLMTNDGDPTEYDPCYVPESSFNGKSGLCIITSPAVKTNLYFGLYAANTAYSGVSFACTFQSIVVPSLSNWVVYTDSNLAVDSIGKNERVSQYSLNKLVDSGQQVSCSIKPSASVVTTLEIFYGNATNGNGTLGCSSATECVSDPAVAPSFAYAQVTTQPFATSQPVTMDILCGNEPTPTVITDGFTATGIAGTVGGDSALQVFQLDGVIKGEVVACSMTGASSGSANMYVKAGAIPHPLSTRYACQAIGVAGCTTPLMSRDASVFVALHAVADFADATLTCIRNSSLCRPPSSKCRNTRQCCGSGTTCDGLTRKSRRCIDAILPGGACVRSSQCYQGYNCQLGTCL